MNRKSIFRIEMMLVFIGSISFAQNPLIQDQYTADPSARVFGDRVYVFPSHDILATEGKGRKDWFCMEDYHVFSSANLTDWTDHGMIVQQNKVLWVKPDGYSMWAPDCIERNGKYYFYFPSTPKDTINSKRGFTVGVAIANQPEGPYIPEPNPIKGISGIDPNVFIDKDGQAYLYWSGGNIFVAKLKENMTELESEVKTIENLPTKGLKEGPYLFERNGIYYLTYPHVENKIERLEYATGDNPLGPFKVAGVIMDESPTGCWTNHHSIIEFKKQWYLFYHHNDLSPEFDKLRSIRADYLYFNPDGSIQKVVPTLRGVGITKATNPIQIDRYSKISDKGSSISFLDNSNSFEGWKTTFNQSDAWIQYNSIDFGKKKLKSVSVRAMSEKGGVLQIRTKGIDGAVIAEVTVPKNSEWVEVKSPLLQFDSGVQDVFVVSKNDNQVEVDWVKFE
ncbi:Carbohydrate binding module (family 6) [Flavobacterium glycines]|uniref:Alpha-N-arabinofuranosidase n=1 Tax=Flavobacterium glycines TaxID=551990 RepID=A0A1B9DG49_9FLAO|nr:family 43 glycosylhydrolase [Flavobacterium glycines]OCB68684.1 alpha-N-arabinofuranosidase [Flavobacterium glycines]GEL11453.1 hypothetical protein FGL01_21920 [Flavobacterium glycines]SDJ64562.1 Carbohydrate binding module (family 6) [Flavobacterium glycines]